ncbi:hypothetical protein B0J11DRAFT_51864 [Dendryphion nanum]|uniref:Rhodopsin domain-containing protein n=1 Tax=Dendryphion nanum TaxID=256645 RepID=A0A9P9DK16_9PLEO|nr:hypothetical protein B0J11DRAFT_51864 [Dendryphion nanum]
MPAWGKGVERPLRRQDPTGPPLLPVLTPEEIAYTNAPEILAITATFFGLAAAVVVLRCYVRVVMLKIFKFEDWLMVLAMCLAAAVFAFMKIETDLGLGRHFMAMLMDPVKYMQFAKILYVHSIIVMVALSTVKISIAFFLLRLSDRAGLYAKFLYGVIVFIILMTIACALTLIFQCLPVEAAWDYRLRPPPFGFGTAKCYDMIVFRNLGLMNSSFNIVTDVLFATLPIPLIWQLQLNLRTKISLILVLSLGWFACAAATVKAVLQFNVLNDFDWTVHNSFNVWNYIELTVGIMAASLPTLKPLFNWFLETARAITSGGTRRSGYKGPNSLGYQKTDGQSKSSFKLQSFSSRGDSSPKGAYNVKISTNPTGLADKEALDALRSKGSDESILLQRPEPVSNSIMITTDVRIA